MNKIEKGHAYNFIWLGLLMLLAHQQVFALGLGNVEVKSHLGQNLHAAIALQGASDIKDASCFSVLPNASDPNQLNVAYLALSNLNGDEAVLNVTSYQIMNDPIVNLSIQAGCGANVRRDYVILLDPPTMKDTVTQFSPAPLEQADDMNQADNKKSNKKMQGNESAEPQAIYAKSENSADTPKKASKKKSKKNKNASDVADNGAINDVNVGGSKAEAKMPSADSDALKLTPKSLGTQDNTAAPVKSAQEQPRLKISGGDALANASPLTFDKQLHFTPETAPLPVDAEIAVQDEATVLSNRLLHLEKQFNVISLSNKKLKAENATMSAELSEAKSWNNRFDWLGYIIGGGLLMTSIVLADKWRRQRQIDALEYAQLTVKNNRVESDHADLFQEPIVIENATELEAEPEEELPESPTLAFNDEPNQAPFLIEDYDSDHNILDHADVFLSHGRTNLAIQLLQNHLLDYPKQSVTVWLFLLDLLAKENMQAVYEQTALECKEYFNIRIADFSNDEASTKQHFEDFPRLVAGLEQVWGTAAAITYLEDLIYNSRLETRVGFEKNVVDELLLLKNIAQEVVGIVPPIMLDEKKMAIKAQKEAQLAAKKAEKMQQLLAAEQQEEEKIKAVQASDVVEAPPKKDMVFEFDLVDYKDASSTKSI